MTEGRQIQRAGGGSQQLQVAGDLIVNTGITEERAHEISLANAKHVVAQFASESHGVLQARVDELDQRVITHLSNQGALDSFADPAFIRSYRKAQEGAASSERPADYDMLAALLADRAKSARERPTVVGIDGAIDVVDRIDEDALRALTIANAIEQWTVKGPLVGPGISLLNDIFESLVDGPLPMAAEWLDHLDVLNVVRRNTLTGMKPMEEFYSEQFVGCIAPGAMGSGDAGSLSLVAELTTVLASEGWPVRIVPHELKAQSFRVGAMNRADLDRQLKDAGKSDEYVSRVISLAETEFGFGQQDDAARTELMTRMRALPSLGTVMEWWDSNADSGFYITPIGRALARANAFRLDTENRLTRE
ncbi:LPO_1073/Vpar_1526 family protein [Microbacterium hominis]|uniref:LPO_1073/Vpar_1526 family protein n=1 Tax=Microbacterium hominis TaxID=162426 RepID=UPI000768940D|nr:LPO_1073/Vpar_1526 family protein [Microbacterium hominis]KXC06431.1 hypothetical protein MhomT_05710 [Microbacterium hominis]